MSGSRRPRPLSQGKVSVPFAPAMEWQESVFPPYLDQLPDREGILAIWAELAGLVRHPVIKARASDLLWCIQSVGDWSKRWGSNPRPSAWEAGAQAGPGVALCAAACAACWRAGWPAGGLSGIDQKR